MSAPVPHDGIVVRNARLAVKNELEKKRLLNQPIARFDPKSGKVYMELFVKVRENWRNDGLVMNDVGYNPKNIG